MTQEFMQTVKPDPGLLAFVLGAQPYRVSLHTQQVRAIKLAAALQSDEEFIRSSSAAVIGGGAAGLTIAIALAATGKVVSLFEKSTRFIPLQYYNHTRYVHPHSVTWPEQKFSPTSDLPFMNWYADYSGLVARKLFEKFRGLKSALNLNIIEERGAFVTSCEKKCLRGTNTFELKWGTSGVGRFDSIFFANGFPHERKISAFDNFSYWEDTSVIPRRTNSIPPRVAIIGDGDGALIDAARCIYHYQDLELIYDGIARKYASKRFRRIITSIEGQLLFSENPILPEEYYEAFCSEVYRPEVNEFFNRFEEHDCDLTVIGESERGLSYRASPINKFIFLFLLLKRPNKVRFIRARASGVRASSPKGHSNIFRYSVALDRNKGSRDGFTTGVLPGFDRVLERLGPKWDSPRLLAGLFGESLVTEFLSRNRSRYSFANPTQISAEEIGRISDRFSEGARMSEGSNDLLRYISMLMGGEIKDSSSQIGYSIPRKAFEVEGLILPRELKTGETPGLGGTNRIQELPKHWYGKKLYYTNISREDLRKDRDIYGPMAQAAFNAAPTVPLTKVIHAGQRIRLRSSDFSSPPDGRLCYFVRLFNLVSNEAFGDVYALAPRHIVQSLKDDPNIYAVGLNKDGSGSEKLRIIGRLGSTPIDDKILAETRSGTFSSLSDVALIKINRGQAVTNSIDGIPLKSVNPVYNVAERNESAFFGEVELGKISKVFNHTSIKFPMGAPVPSETFSVKCRMGVSAQSVMSGTVITTRDGGILGMAVASLGDEVFCLESFKIHRKLGLQLA